MRTTIVILCTLFGLQTFAQLSEDKAFNGKLIEILSRDVEESFVKEIHSDTSIMFLDSREKKEYDVSHIQDATWVGYETFSMKSVKSIPKDTKIVVYCTVGYRSEIITKKLSKAGFTNVSNLIGGIVEWKNLGFIVLDSSNNKTEKVHTYDKDWSIWLKKGVKVF